MPTIGSIPVPSTPAQTDQAGHVTQPPVFIEMTADEVSHFLTNVESISTQTDSSLETAYAKSIVAAYNT